MEAALVLLRKGEQEHRGPHCNVVQLMNQSIKLAITWPPDLLYETVNLLLLNLQTIHHPTGYAIWNQKCKFAPYPQLKSHFSLGDNNHFNKLKSPQPHLTKVSEYFVTWSKFLSQAKWLADSIHCWPGYEKSYVFLFHGAEMRMIKWPFLEKSRAMPDSSSPSRTYTHSCIGKNAAHERTAGVPWASVNTSVPWFRESSTSKRYFGAKKPTKISKQHK